MITLTQPKAIVGPWRWWGKGALTQAQIDRPGRYFPVTEDDKPILPSTAKNPWPWPGPKEKFINGDRSECIPGADIISILRKQAEKQGKPVEIREVKDGDGRWMKTVGWWTLVIVGLFFWIRLIIDAVRRG